MASTTSVLPLPAKDEPKSPVDDPQKLADALAGRASGDDKPKRKRQSQSCDACRARKVKCAREGPEDDPQQACKHCISLGIPCTYDYQPKKRGPPNLYLRRLQEQQAAAAAAQHGQHHQHNVNGNGHSNGNGAASPSSLSPPSAGPSSAPYGGHSGLSPLALAPPPIPPPQQQQQVPSLVAPPPPVQTSLAPPPAIPPSIPPSRYPIAADQFAYAPPDQSFGGPYPLYNLPPAAPPVPVPPPPAPAPPPVHAGSHFPSLRQLHRPHRIDSVAPRERIGQIIGLFFDFVYPLTPCVHKPTFLADFAARREESDPLFFALVMSTVASTLVQVPRSYVPMERAAVRKLAQECHEASRHVTIATYDPPTSTHVVIRYFDTVYHFCEGHDATSHAAFGEAAHIAVTLHMHEEASYEGLDPIECEMRRRTFWLLFSADKSMSILLGRPICLRDEDCTLHFPKEVDDEYITPNGILPQPAGKTAIVSGLNYCSRIFALLGEILVRIRVDKRSPPQGPFLTARLEEVKSLHARIMGALAHTPPPLRLKPAGVRTGAVASMLQAQGRSGPGFAQQTFAEVRDFFDNPNANRENASNHFLVMQGNLYVTQQLVRFVIEQYRDELMTSMRQSLGGDIKELESSSAEDREAVASDLLNVLHSIPIQSIATNGPSLVHKVRFVASTLLDAVRKAEEAPASAARAHAYLWDFLSILSEIERNYIMDDEKDVPPDAMTT